MKQSAVGLLLWNTVIIMKYLLQMIRIDVTKRSLIIFTINKINEITRQISTGEFC